MKLERGINLGGYLSQCVHSTEHYDAFIQEEDIRKIASMGFDHVRLAIDYEVLEDEYGRTREEGFAYVTRVVEWCKRQGLNIVLDLHKAYGYDFNNAGDKKKNILFTNKMVQKRFVKLWIKIAEHYANETHVAFELLNEVVEQENAEALQREESTLKEIPQRIVDEAFGSVNELLTIDRMGIAVYNETTHLLEYASSPGQEMPEMVQLCFDSREYISEQHRQAIPLMVEAGGEHQCVGVLYLERREGTEQETDRLLFELVARYVAIVVFNAVVKLATKYRDIESAHEETQRASWEDSMLHVQNMVLDNCLSTIKHETIYYPNKIKQIIGRLNAQNLSEKEEKEAVETMTEVIEYYKGIFTILSSCASRQLEEVTFRRTTIPVQELFETAGKYFKKSVKNRMDKIELEMAPIDARVIGDVNQLRFLLENLIDEALTVHEDGVLRLQARKDDEYIRFLFTDTRREKSVLELNQLFYPNLARMTSGEEGELRGTEYLVCKQIIRDHDEFAGRRGCRINAEPAEGGGFTVYFTIPRR